MKTKKEIIEFWNKIGQLPAKNDYKLFKEALDKSILITKSENDNLHFQLKLTRKNWKVGLYLFFYYDENVIDCYKICY